MDFVYLSQHIPEIHDTRTQALRRSIRLRLPACFAHAGNHPIERQLAKTETAKAKLSIDRPLSTAQFTPPHHAAGELGLILGFVTPGFCRH